MNAFADAYFELRKMFEELLKEREQEVIGKLKRKRETEDLEQPKHYELKGLEPYTSMDIIKAVLNTLELKGIQAFFLGNILKYLFRFTRKDEEKDLEKAEVYLKWLMEDYKKKSKPKSDNAKLKD